MQGECGEGSVKGMRVARGLGPTHATLGIIGTLSPELMIRESNHVKARLTVLSTVPVAPHAGYRHVCFSISVRCGEFDAAAGHRFNKSSKGRWMRKEMTPFQ